MKPVYIFDLDGTLALIDHRRRLVEQKPPDWPRFYRECVNDLPNIPIINIMNILSAHAHILILSGRSDEVAAETAVWITNHIKVEGEIGILMRPQGDYTPDDELKKQWVTKMLQDPDFHVAAVFDDRDKVVKMWRQMGLCCLQVAPGDF